MKKQLSLLLGGLLLTAGRADSFAGENGRKTAHFEIYISSR